MMSLSIAVKVFNMNCAQPIYEHDRLSETPITNAIFIPYPQESADDSSGALSWQQRAQLYFINHKQVIIRCVIILGVLLVL